MCLCRSILPRQILLAVAAVSALWFGGCTSLHDYVRQGFKVGPNYCKPPAPVADHWIDEADVHVSDEANLARWWTVFRDPVLDRLIAQAYQQNLTLRQASFRILEARAQLAIAKGEIFPQQQYASGGYQRIASSNNYLNSGSQFYDQYGLGFNLSWELDFWGRLRRAVAAADANLEASVADFDQVLVTLLGDVASNYVTIRTDQERIRFLRQNVTIQELVLEWTKRREKVGFRTLPLDVHQTESILEETAAGIPQLEIDLRQAENRLCILMGMPAVDLRNQIGEDRIPTAPAQVAIGLPAGLLRNRPDVRRAERLAAAQAEMIGIAQANLYPVFSINGTLGAEAQDVTKLFEGQSLAGNVGPTFQWNILNYGRIVSNVRYQDAKFKELVAAYQQTVLQADREVEDGLVTFVRAQDRTQHLNRSVNAATASVKDIFLPTALGRAGFDFSRFALIEQNKVQQQDLLSQARGQIALGLIQIYRALGGGWELRNQPIERLPPVGALPSVPPEGEAELGKLRNLLSPQTNQPGNKTERLPLPEPVYP